MRTELQAETNPSAAAPVLDRPPSEPTASPPDAEATSHPASGPSDIDPKILIALLQLESQARTAQTAKELCFLLANETRRLVNFRQACVFSIGMHLRAACQVEAVSSVAVLDRKAPMVQWMEGVVASHWENQTLQEPVHLNEEQCPKHLQADWQLFAFPHVLWCPLILSNQRVMGGIWLAR